MQTAKVDLLDIDPFALVDDEVPWVAVTAHTPNGHQHNQKSHAGDPGVSKLVGPLLGSPVFDAEKYAQAYGDVVDERSMAIDEDGMALTVRFFESSDAHLVIDLPDGRHQVIGEFDSSDAMRSLADSIRTVQHEKIPDRPATGDIVADHNSHDHPFYVAKDDYGDIRLRDDDAQEDDYLDLGEDEAWELFDALDDMADSFDDEFEEDDEDEAVAAQLMPVTAHLPGKHDQSSHGRKKGISVPDVPAMLSSKPASKSSPAKSRAKKKATTSTRTKRSGVDGKRARALAQDVRSAADEVDHLPPMGRSRTQQARQIADSALDDIAAQDLGRADVSAQADALRAEVPDMQPHQIPPRLRQLADLIDSEPNPADDQGAGRTASGVRSALRRAKTAAEVSAAAQKESERLTESGVYFNLDGADTEVAKELAEGVLRGLERFPRTDLSRIRLSSDMRGDAMARVDGDEILISADWAGDPARYRDTLRHYHDEGHFVGDSPMATAIHEFGHLVALTGDSEDSAGKLLLTTARRREVGESGLRDFVQSQISTYAARNDPEMTAEAFADVMLNGDRASDLSKVIFKHIETKYGQAVG